ncbi:MAG: 30S ribosomal protein S6 [Desulfobacterium sp.]
MRRYETIFIADPDLQEDARKNLFDKYKNLLVQEKGILVDFDDWGNRKLAYPIKKKARGHYVCMTYGGTGELVIELERNFRLDDKVQKFMTVLLEKNVTASALEAEIAAAAQPEEVKEAAPAAAQPEEVKKAAPAAVQPEEGKEVAPAATDKAADEVTEVAEADTPEETKAPETQTAEAAQEEN